MKAKPVLIVIIILLIGFILGWLTSAQVRIQKLKPVRLYYSEDRFMEGFFKTIQPDDKQKAEIEKILDKYAKLNSDLMTDFRKESESNLKAMRKELDSKLTKEQITRLKEMDERRQEMIRQSRRHRNDSSYNRRPGPDSRQDSLQRKSFHHDMEQGPSPGPPPPPPPPSQDTSDLDDDK